MKIIYNFVLHLLFPIIIFHNYIIIYFEIPLLHLRHHQLNLLFIIAPLIQLYHLTFIISNFHQSIFSLTYHNFYLSELVYHLNHF
jgi:hypothetical protein